MVRSLNGLSTGSVRSLNGLTNEFGGLNGFGIEGQIIRTTGSRLEYSNQCNLSDIFTTASTGTEKRFYEYTEGQTLITIGNATDNLVFYNGSNNAISMPSVASASNLVVNTSFISTGTIQDTDFILMLDGDGTTFEKVLKTNFISGIGISANTPLVLSGGAFSLSSLSGYGTNGQIIKSTGSALAYSNDCKLSDIKTTNANLLEGNRFFEYTTSSDLITIGNETDTMVFFNSNSFAISMPVVSSASTLMTNNSFTTITSLQDTDFILILDGDNTTLEKITKTNFITDLGVDTTTANDFGTASQTGTRTLGLATQNTDIKGAFINNIGTTISFQVGANVLGSFANQILSLNTGTLLRIGDTTLTNSMSSVYTECNIQTDKDIHLFSVGQNFANSRSRISFIAGSSQAICGTLGYSGSSISVANGGTPEGGSGTGVIQATFVNGNGTSANIALCITPIATDITSKKSKLLVNLTDTTSYNPITLGNDSYTGSGAGIIDTGTSLDLLLKCSTNNVLVSDFSIRRNVIIGRGSKNYATYTSSSGLTVLNNADDVLDVDFYKDARFKLESTVNGTVPVIELIINSGINSSTKYAGYLFIDSNGSIFFNTSVGNPRQEVVINGQNLRTNDKVYFTNITNAGDAGVYFIKGSDEEATSGGFGWRMDIGNTGDLHFRFAEGNITSITTISGYINHEVSNSQMNFTGQHRCIPQEEILYNNVNDYIGMVVEATGEYNSIFTEEEEYDFELITKIEEEYDISTNKLISEGYIKKEIVRKKKQTHTTTNEPTINEAQPIIRLTTTAKSKKVYGIISSKEDGHNRVFQQGVFTTDLGLRNDNRLFINSLGEGGILVCNQNGNIENGDLLCSSDIPGIAMKQIEEYVANYTIGKATQDYNFTGNENKLIGCVYYCG